MDTNYVFPTACIENNSHFQKAHHLSWPILEFFGYCVDISVYDCLSNGGYVI